MRKLKVRDIAPAVKLAKAMDCGKEIKEITVNEANENNAGLEIINLVLTKYSESERIQKLVAEFLAGPFEMSADDILDMDIDDFIDGIKKIGGLTAITSFFGNALA